MTQPIQPNTATDERPKANPNTAGVRGVVLRTLMVGRRFLWGVLCVLGIAALAVQFFGMRVPGLAKELIIIAAGFATALLIGVSLLAVLVTPRSSDDNGLVQQKAQSVPKQTAASGTRSVIATVFGLTVLAVMLNFTSSDTAPKLPAPVLIHVPPEPTTQQADAPAPTSETEPSIQTTGAQTSTSPSMSEKEVVALGVAEGAEAACDDLKLTAATVELRRRWKMAKPAEQRELQFNYGMGRDSFGCVGPITGLTCQQRNLARCGKAIQAYGPAGWILPGLLAAGAASPFASDMPPGPVAKPARKRGVTRDRTPDERALGTEIAKSLRVGSSVADLLNGATSVAPPPYNEVNVSFTVYHAATPSDVIATAAETAIKVGRLVAGRKGGLGGKRLRFQMAIFPNKQGTIINAFTVAWPEVAVLKAAAEPDGATRLAATAMIEEVWGSYWPALCSNLPRPEQFVDGGDEPEHALDIWNPHKRDLGCVRRKGSDIRVGTR